MPELGWIELLLIMVLVLVVLGPNKLPEVARSLGLWVGRLRRIYNNFKLELDREVGMDDVRRQLHNEQIMSEMKALENETKTILSDTQANLADTANIADEPQKEKSDAASPDFNKETKAGQTRNG